MSWDPTKKTPAKNSKLSKSLKVGGTPSISRNGTVEMAKIEEEPNEDSGSSGEVDRRESNDSVQSQQSNDSDTKTLQVPQQKENEQVTDDESKEVGKPEQPPAAHVVAVESSQASNLETGERQRVAKNEPRDCVPKLRRT